MTFADNTREIEHDVDANYFELIECSCCHAELKVDDAIEDERNHLLNFCSIECQSEYWVNVEEARRDGDR